MERFLFFTAVLFLFIAAGCANRGGDNQQEASNDNYRSELFIDLPDGYNTPDGLAMSPEGLLILSVPNFNNERLMERGVIGEPSPAFMAHIKTDNSIEKWYEFREEDLHPETEKVGPMDGAFGPDGHLYVADMQVFYNDDHKSRLIRINVENGEAVDMDVVATGFNASNGTFWEGNTLFVTESVLEKREDTLISGVYAFDLDELQGDVPVELKSYKNGSGDEHLVVTFKSDNHMGFGADGITFDDRGYLFTTVIEAGKIYRSEVDENNKATETELFAEDPNLTAPDGLIFDRGRGQFFVADFLGNAVHEIDRKGNVTTLQKNGDVTGANGGLDQPAEVILRGRELIIVNMDMAWAAPELSVNKKVDSAHNLAVIYLDPRPEED